MRRKNSLRLLIILLLMNCPPLVAKSQLTISKEFKVISVNGKTPSQNSPLKSFSLNLNSGLNIIAIAYESFFKNNNDQFEIIKSNVFVVSFYLSTDGIYRLLHLKQANLKAAKNFIRNPLINIVNQDGRSIKFKQFYPRSQSLESIHKSTKRNIEKQKPIRLVSKKVVPIKQEKNKTMEDAEAMLLFWWQQASPQQRQSFLNKIESID